MDQSSVSAGLVSGLIDYAQVRGADRAALMTHAGLTPDTLCDPDARIPFGTYAKLTRHAKTLTGNPALSIQHAEEVGMSQLSVVGLIMEASATMGEAFLQLQRYGRLAAEVDHSANGPPVALIQKDGKLFMQDCRPPTDDFYEWREMSFVRLVCGPRRFLDQPHVLSVAFSHKAPSYRDEYDRIFQCPVEFEQDWDAMELHPEIAGWKVAQNPAYVFGVLTAHADRLLAELDAAKTMRGTVEKHLLTCLHQGEVGIEHVASTMSVSRQTLFRRLKGEGTSFADILEALRERLAKEYLLGRKASVHETAYLLGYSEPAAFTRAFKRWTGLSPSEFQRQP